MRNAGSCLVLALLAVVPACGGDGERTHSDAALGAADAPVVTPDAGLDVEAIDVPGDAGALDDATSDAAAPVIDLAPAVPTVCAIAAKLAPEQPDAGLALPSVHELSLAIDWAGDTAATGSGGTARRVPLVHEN